MALVAKATPPQAEGKEKVSAPYQYRKATGSFGYGPNKRACGRMSAALKRSVAKLLRRERELGLAASAASVKDWWERKKARTREARNARLRAARATRS